MKQRQVELEELIAKSKSPQGELPDAFTGEFFKPRCRNHYEVNDGKPVAPMVELNRPTIRQRIENLLNRDPGVLHRYITEGPPDGTEGVEMDIPDDAEAPLTASEQNYVEQVAAELAEAAPLPDEGLPRLEAADPGSSTAAASLSGVKGAEPPSPAASPQATARSLEQQPQAPGPVPTR